MELERACPAAAHWTEYQYRQLFERVSRSRLVLVAEEVRDDSSIYGFLVARSIDPEWELENIAVAAGARRKGLAKRLLDALLARAQETNSQSVFLEVRESNAAARTLYERGGFQQAGLRKSYYTNPLEDAVVYRRRVEAKSFS